MPKLILNISHLEVEGTKIFSTTLTLIEFIEHFAKKHSLPNFHISQVQGLIEIENENVKNLTLLLENIKIFVTKIQDTIMDKLSKATIED